MSFHKDVPWGGGESTMDLGHSSFVGCPTPIHRGLEVIEPIHHTTVLTARLVVSVTQRLKLLSSG